MTRAGLLAAALAAGLLLPGCALRAEDTPRALPASEAPLLPAPQSPALASGGGVRERLFLVHQNRLVEVARTAPRHSAALALRDLLAGPTAGELRRGLTTALPGGTRATVRALEEGVAVVELDGDLGLGRSDQVLALGQVVATLDASPGVQAVRFVQAGRPLPVPGSDGALSDQPLDSDDYRSFITGTQAPVTG